MQPKDSSLAQVYHTLHQAVQSAYFVCHVFMARAALAMRRSLRSSGHRWAAGLGEPLYRVQMSWGLLLLQVLEMPKLLSRLLAVTFIFLA
jgi:hypothetical protein